MTGAEVRELERNEAYGFNLTEDGKVLLFTWYHVPGLSVALFQSGITDFARRCKAHKPSYAVINASALDQNSPAVAWLRSHAAESEVEDYNSWWGREIVPLYHDAGITGLAVATGDPNAPGELPGLPPELRFKVGYFPDLETSLAWQPK